jgi:hypothetical protein
MSQLADRLGYVLLTEPASPASSAVAATSGTVLTLRSRKCCDRSGWLSSTSLPPV